jgi:hypothetical protein
MNARASWGVRIRSMFPSPHRRACRKDRPVCGALTRAGGLCRVRVEPGKARCRFHGGLSTGPKTPEGRARIAEAQRRRWSVFRDARTDGSEPPIVAAPKEGAVLCALAVNANG